MGLVDQIKNQVKKSGTNKGKFIYFKPGVKVRVRFLQDMDDGFKFPFHDSFSAGINVPCQELFGKSCDHCENEELRHRDQYAWSVWDHEAKEVKILMGAVSSVSPVPALVGMYEAYGTLTDRDYVITKNGTGTTATFTVVPMDKAKFKNEKAKPFSESKALDLLNKAWPDDSDEDDEEDEDEKPKSKKKGKKESDSKGKGKSKKKPDPEEDEDEDEDLDYDDMSAKDLYSLCKERDIECKPKKDKEYYIELLEEYDEDHDEDDDDEEDW